MEFLFFPRSPAGTNGSTFGDFCGCIILYNTPVKRLRSKSCCLSLSEMSIQRYTVHHYCHETEIPQKAPRSFNRDHMNNNGWITEGSLKAWTYLNSVNCLMQHFIMDAITSFNLLRLLGVSYCNYPVRVPLRNQKRPCDEHRCLTSAIPTISPIEWLNVSK